MKKSMGYDAGYIDGFFHDDGWKWRNQLLFLLWERFVKASHPMIQYVGRVSFAKNPDVASFIIRELRLRLVFKGLLKMLCRPKTGYFMAQIDGCEPFKVGFLMPNAIRL